jgi:hypothetical protein
MASRPPPPSEPVGEAAPSSPPALSFSARVVSRTEPDPFDPRSEFPLQAVGESFYQDAPRAIVDGHPEPGGNYPDSGCECRVQATLVPEGDNPHDANAVRVEIQGRKVGHLSRADAVRYRRIFERNAIPIGALILGGWDIRYRDPDYEKATGTFGVRLALRIEDRSE